MNLLSLFKRILNTDGPQIDLVARDSKYFPSEWIRGDLLITATDYRQNIKSITINLKEYWIEYPMGGRTRVDRYRQHDSITVANDFALLPRMHYKIPFEIQLPADCRVSSEESGWRLGVAISTSGSSILRADFNISVQLSKALKKIIEVIEKETQFMEVPRGREYNPDTSATRFVFRPPEHLRSELQYFMLDVSLNEEGGIKGNMLFKRSESGSFSMFTTNTGEDYSGEFQIKLAQLFDSEGEVERRTITKTIFEKMMEALGSKNH
jgi:hypothetical protein